MAVGSDCGDFHRRTAAGAGPQLHPSVSPSRVAVAFGRHDLAARLGFKTPAPVSVPTEVAWIIASKGADCRFGAEHETGRLAEQVPQRIRWIGVGTVKSYGEPQCLGNPQLK
jgi:hypothetical protein